MTEVIGKVYPNGEFGITRVKRFNPEPLPEVKLTRKQELTIEYLPVIGIDGIKAVDGDRAAIAPLGSSSLPNFQNRAKRGSKGITREAARNVRNAVYLMEERYPRKVLSFVTLTLPSLSPEEFELVAAQWSKIVNHLVTRLRQDLMRANLPAQLVGVTEIQEQRLTKFGQFAPHLHLLFVGRKPGRSWAITTKRIDSIWQDVLENRLNRKVSIVSSCKMEVPRQSMGKYLSKYMSKGVKIIGRLDVIQLGIVLPSAWHTMTRSLLNWIRQRIVSEPEVINSLWEDCWSETPALVGFHGFITIEVSEGWEYICGAYGRVKSEFLEWLKSDRHENFCRIA